MNALRLYSYPELAADVGSNMPIDPVFADETKQDFLFVNGLYQPTVEMNRSSPIIHRVLHAAGGQPLPLAASSDSCSVTVLAWDGVYLDARLPQEEVNMVAASRVEVDVNYTEAGISIDSDGTVLLHLLVYEVSDDDAAALKASVTDEELASIVRPYYLQDLTCDNVLANSTYTVNINQALRNHSICGYVIGAGSNCSALSVTANTDACP